MFFGIHTDRYLDSAQKSQTASSILNAFSEALNLAHILKICVLTLPYEHTKTGKASWSHRGSLC